MAIVDNIWLCFTRTGLLPEHLKYKKIYSHDCEA